MSISGQERGLAQKRFLLHTVQLFLYLLSTFHLTVTDSSLENIAIKMSRNDKMSENKIAFNCIKKQWQWKLNTGIALLTTLKWVVRHHYRKLCLISSKKQNLCFVYKMKLKKRWFQNAKKKCLVTTKEHINMGEHTLQVCKLIAMLKNDSHDM